MFAERQKLLLHWLPNAEPLDLPGLTHLLHAQDPAAVAGGLTRFFARHPIPEPLRRPTRLRQDELLRTAPTPHEPAPAIRTERTDLCVIKVEAKTTVRPTERRFSCRALQVPCNGA